MSTAIDYTPLEIPPSPPWWRAVAWRHVGAAAAIVSIVSILLFLPTVIQAGWSETSIAGLATVAIGMPIFLVPALLLLLPRGHKTIDLLIDFANTNDFNLTHSPEASQSIPSRSITLAKGARKDDRISISSQWRLDGMQGGRPFAIERLERWQRPAMSAKGRMPQFITAVEIPLRVSLPDIALRSRWLASGPTLFESSCILPFPDWHQFLFEGLADARFYAYFTGADPGFDTAEQQSYAEALLRTLPKKSNYDIEITNGTLFAYFVGVPTDERAAFKQYFAFIESLGAFYEA